MKPFILADIRKSVTGLNQEAFFDAYLKGVPGVGEQTTGASKQNFVSKVENQNLLLLPASILKVYADLAGCSLDALATGTEYKAPEPEAPTYSDILRALAELVRAGGIISVEQGSGVAVQDPIYQMFVQKLVELKKMVDDKTLDEDVLKAWVRDTAQKADGVPVLNYNDNTDINRRGPQKADVSLLDMLKRARGRDGWQVLGTISADRIQRQEVRRG